MKTTAHRFLAIAFAASLVMLAGCHAGLDGAVLNTDGFDIGDLLRPVGGPGNDEERVRAGDPETPGGAEAPSELAPEAPAVPDGAAGGNDQQIAEGPPDAPDIDQEDVAEGDDEVAAADAVAEEDDVADDVAGEEAARDPDPDAPRHAVPPPPAQVIVVATTCSSRPNHPLCLQHAQDIVDPSRVAVITWKLIDIRAAYMRLQALQDADRISRFQYTSFLGVPVRYTGIHSNAPSADDRDFAADLLSDPLHHYDRVSPDNRGLIAQDDHALPFSYCEINTPNPIRNCFDGQRNVPAEDIIFFPLRTDETSRSGVWLMPINGDERSFEVAFLDLNGGVHIQQVNIIRADLRIFRPGPRDPRQIGRGLRIDQQGRQYEQAEYDAQLRFHDALLQ